MRTFLIVSLLLAGSAGAAVGVFGLPPCCPFGKDAQTTGIAASTAPTDAWTQTSCCPGDQAQPVAQQPAVCYTAECPREACEKSGAGCSAEKKAECEQKRLAD